MPPGALEAVTAQLEQQAVRYAGFETVVREPSPAIIQGLSPRYAAQHVEQVELRRPGADDAAREPASMGHVDHEIARRPCHRNGYQYVRRIEGSM
jgi:hypothetical protein